MAALAAGHSLYDTVDGTAPCTFQLPHSQPSPPLHNAEPGGGVLTLLNATALSVNCAYLRLGVDLGLGLGKPQVPDMAHLLGIPSGATVPNVISAAIGGGVEVTPLQMATAYSTLTGDGVRHAPENADGPAQFVQSVVDPAGHVLVGGGNSRPAGRSRPRGVHDRFWSEHDDRHPGSATHLSVHHPLPVLQVAAVPRPAAVHHLAAADRRHPVPAPRHQSIGFTPSPSQELWVGAMDRSDG